MTRALSVILLNSLIALGFTACQPGKQTTTTIRTETPTAQALPTRQMPPPESQPESQPSGPAAPIIDPKADRILKEMSDYLKAQGQFSLHVQISQDGLLPTGQKIQFEAVNDIAVRRPDHVFSEYYYTKDHDAYKVVPPPEGVMISSLPNGAVSKTINGVNYFECGGAFYRPFYSGSDVVYEIVKNPGSS